MKNFYLKIVKEISELNFEIGSSGNVSFLNGGNLLITPTGKTFADGLLIDKNSNDIKPSSDVDAHSAIYSARKDIVAIYHTHSHYSALASQLSSDIPVFSTMHADYFGEPIKLVKFSNHRQTGFGQIKQFSSGSAFLLEKHGGLLFFSQLNMNKILNIIISFEEICRLYCDLSMMGSSKIVKINNRDAKIMHDYYHSKYGQ